MWKQTQLSWSERETPEELRRLLVRLGEEYPIRPNGEGRRLVFCQAPVVPGPVGTAIMSALNTVR